MKPSMIGRMILAILLCLVSSGCFGLMVGNPYPFAYVLYIGGPDKIARWTLEQTDGRKISDGLGALRYKVGDGRDKTATNAYLMVLEKVEGWPPERKPPAKPGDLYTAQVLLSHEFFMVAFDAYSNPFSYELLLKVRPSGKNARWLLNSCA